MKTKIEHWMKLRDELKVVKEAEMQLRQEIISALFPVYVEGTNTREEENGDKIIYKCVVNRKVVKDPSNILDSMPDGLFKIEWKLSKLVYDRLTIEQLDIVDGYIESKIGAGTLDVRKKENE